MTRSGTGGVVVTVLCGMALVPLNSSMIVVALPAMATELDVPLTTMTWLVTAYLIAMAALQPVAGKLGDRLGRRPVLLGGYVLFGLASGLAALAPSLPVLIGCRLVTAAAGALLVPTGSAVLREAVPRERLGRVFGYMGALLPAAAAAGPVLGGVLVSLAGWQAVFLVNVPAATLALLLGLRTIPRGSRAPANGRFDLLGAGWLCALLIGVTLLLDEAPGGLVLAGWCAALVIGITGFIGYELRRADPMLQPRLFARRGFAASAGATALANFAFYVAMLAIPMLLHGRAGVSEGRIGLILGALTVAASPLALLGGRLADRAGTRVPTVAGMVLIAGGLVPLTLVPGEIGQLQLAGTLAVIGAGVGLSMPAFQLGAVTAVDTEDTGVATGVLMTSRYLGSVAGTSLLAGPLAPADSGFPALFGVLAVVAAAGVLVAAALPRAPRPQPVA